MEQIKTPTEQRTANIEWVLKKYLDKKNIFSVTFQADDKKFNRILTAIKGEK